MVSMSTDSLLRLELIQATVGVLQLNLKLDEFTDLTGLIEALCRHSDLPISHCLSETRIALLERLGVDVRPFLI